MKVQAKKTVCDNPVKYSSIIDNGFLKPWKANNDSY
jgi:hypothetical protein